MHPVKPKKLRVENLQMYSSPLLQIPQVAFFLLLPREDIFKLDMSVGDGMKMLISGGAVIPPRSTKSSVGEGVGGPPQLVAGDLQRGKKWGLHSKNYCSTQTKIIHPESEEELGLQFISQSERTRPNLYRASY